MPQDTRPYQDSTLEQIAKNIDTLPMIRGQGKEWLLKVQVALNQGNYSDLDNLLTYAARLISRFC